MSRARAIAFSVAGGAIAAGLVANVAFAQDHGFGGGGFRGGRRGDGFVMTLLPLVVLGAVIGLAVVLWRGRSSATPVSPTGPPPAASPTFNAQVILADRLARGEISPEDYRAAITVLRETPPPPLA